MSSKNKHYRIHRIRMINFHNFTNETITVENGGHLFLLGDNGSGKTTVLDAVHYVLSPESMEFNSAARVSGSRRDSGRRAQGIVMRYNTGPGEMNPTGGVSYAAIELIHEDGRMLTLAVGFSCRSMDESIERWGVVCSKPLEEIPFLMEELGGERPRNRREMKEALKPNTYFGKIGSYAREVASRLYGDERTYKEVCEFLSTSKAYREIVSSTADYHQRFRELLQEPDAEVFRKVIDSLVELDRSREDLERLSEKLAFLAELNERQQAVETLCQKQGALVWLVHSIRTKRLLKEMETTHERCHSDSGRLDDLKSLIEKTRSRSEELRERIIVLEQKDKEGLVSQERSVSRDMNARKGELKSLEKEWSSIRNRLSDQTRDLQKAREDLKRQINQHYKRLYRATEGLPLSAKPVLNLLDDAASSETPEKTVSLLNPKTVRDEADELLIQAVSAKRDLDAEKARLAEKHEALEIQLTEKRKQTEPIPNIEGFLSARRALSEKMCRAEPLYSALVPKVGIRPKELAMLEQLIGDEVLGTWLVSSQDEAVARQILFSDYPEQTIAVKDLETNEPVAEWIAHYFDYEHSDPAAIRALHEEMRSTSAPRLEKLSAFDVLRFRARQRRADGAPARLLGEASRKKQYQKELAAIETELRAVQFDQKKTKGEQEKNDQQIGAFKHVKEMLEFYELHSVSRNVSERVSTAQLTSTKETLLETQCMTAEENYALAAAKLADLRARIETDGLQGLEKRIEKNRKTLRKVEQENEANQREVGRLETDIKRAQNRLETLRKESHAESENERLAEDALRKRVVFNDIQLAVRERCDPSAYATEEQVDEAIQRVEVELAETKTELRDRVSSQRGDSFRFVYDKAENTLTDSRGVFAQDVLDERQREYDENKEVFSKETRTVFTEILMHELLTALRDRIGRLKEMSRKINRMLKDRQFGSNQYTFHVHPKSQYKKLEKLVANYSELAPAAALADLTEYVEDHKEEIINADPDEIPEQLDYRNWFHYDLQVKIQGEDGVVMDRKTKSIGSGGEQAVPNYLIILTIAQFLYDVPSVRLPLLLFDEAFYGIDTQRRDQLLAFASDLNLQLFVASPDQDGVKKEISYSSSVLVVKDSNCDIHLHDYHWRQPKDGTQQSLLNPEENKVAPVKFGAEL